MDKKDEMMIISGEDLAKKIYIIRGQKVMLDFELAEIYGYETKAFNQQVKRNIEKFDEDFMFRLTDEEVSEFSRSQNVTLNRGAGRGSNIKYNPHAFTEQGIYMLMTVLKGELAVRQSKALIRTFKQMKDYIVENQGLIGRREFLQLSMQITSNVVEMQDLRRDLRDVEDQVAQVVDTEHQRIYHCGASSKDAGQRITSITEVVDQMIYTDLINKLLKNPVLKLK